MAVSNKRTKRTNAPQSRNTNQEENPNQYYSKNPSWCFRNADSEMWAFTSDHVGDLWIELLPYLSNMETRKWSEILVDANKQNHEIHVGKLNKVAITRLAELHIEAESMVSLRINGTTRLYGFMNGSVFNIVWYDDDHGDSNTCVCRSKLKHT